MKYKTFQASIGVNNTNHFNLPGYAWQAQWMASTAQIHFFKKLGFTPCKAEQPLQGMELQEKESEKD